MDTKTGWLRRLLRGLGYLAGAAALLIVAVLALAFYEALWHRIWTFPREQRSWEALRAERRPVEIQNGWQEFRGVLHTHSKFSHDSEMEFEDILKAARESEIDFLFLTDHCVNQKASFDWQPRGLHDGVLLIPGFEMNYGFLVWNLPPEVTLDCWMDGKLLAHKIRELGGVLFYAHSEEPRMWDSPFYQGMEIYNVHTDFKDEKSAWFGVPYLNLVPDMLLNHAAYPEQTMRVMFDRHDDILARWDSLNEQRKIVGIGASDAHQNTGIRLSVTPDGNLMIHDTSPKPGATLRLNIFSRALLRLFFGPLEPGRVLYRYDFDPYSLSLRFDTTHLLATELSQEALVDALVKGRAFVAFDLIADARGFKMLAESQGRTAVSGESLPYAPNARLRVGSPQRALLRVKRAGEIMFEQVGHTLDYAVPGPGKYRVEAELKTASGWQPWVYTNPVEFRTGQVNE